MDTNKVGFSINSKLYWDARFYFEDWEKNQGQQQTLFFGQLAIDHMPDWLISYIKTNKLSICDFGCALGQATKLLAVIFPNSRVVGQDISESAIEKSKRLFPELEFTSSDLLQTDQEEYDILFSSNTLEHFFYDPFDVINRLSNKASKFLIFLIPFYDDLKIDEHVYSFTYKNIPISIENKFSLIFYKEIDTSVIPNTHWHGRQLLIVYAVDSIIEELEKNKINLTLCKSSKKEYRLALLDSILKIEDEHKIYEFLTFPVKELEQALAQEQAEHQTTKQQLKQSEDFRNYILSSFFWKIAKPLIVGRRIYIRVKNRIQIIDNLFKAHGATKVKNHIKQYGLISTIKYVHYKLFYEKNSIEKKKRESATTLLPEQEITIALKKQKNIKNCIIFQLAFFDFNGEKPFNGGAERYCIDLANLLKEHCFNVIVVQMGNAKLWSRMFKELTVVGLPVRANNDTFIARIASLEKLADLSIYSPFTLSPLKSQSKSLGIIHSMFWDDPKRLYFPNIDDYIEKLKACDLIVSNNITTINWIRGYKGSEFNKKLHYIPNYVDLSLFNSSGSLEQRNDNRMNILFPRRITKDRGFEYITNIFPMIFEKYPNVYLTLAGFVHNDQKENLHAFMRKFSHRVKHIEAKLEEMVALYRKSDIVLIPTPYTEGTSLSCLEAMACGKAIIATNIGGLPELIINGYNGIFVNPCQDELHQALVCLIEDPNYCHYLANNSKKLVHSFSLTKWRDHYAKHIYHLFEHNDQLFLDYNYSDIVIFFEKFMPWNFEYTQRFHHIPSALSDFGYKCIFVGFEHHDQLANETARKIKNNLLLTTDKFTYKNLYAVKNIVHYFNCYAKEVLYVDYLKSLQETNQLIIYDYCDHIHRDIFLSEVPENIIESQEYCLKNQSIIVLTSANTLYEHAVQARGSSRNIYLIENAVNQQDFIVENKTEELNNLFFLKNKTVIGYFSAVANWFDYELVNKIANVYPDFYIVIVGLLNDKLFKKHRLHTKKNIIFRPPVKHNELMSYAKYFDVSIIPFLDNEIIRSCSPVKLFEYMALGKPIITTDMPECRKYKSVLIAKDSDAFISLINKALNIPKDDEYFKIMKKEAKENTWEVRVKIIIEAINENINSSRELSTRNQCKCEAFCRTH